MSSSPALFPKFFLTSSYLLIHTTQYFRSEKLNCFSKDCNLFAGCHSTVTNEVFSLDLRTLQQGYKIVVFMPLKKVFTEI